MSLEAQIAELVQAVNVLTVNQQQTEVARQTLEAEVTQLRAEAAQPQPARTKVGIDTRNLGRPAQFAGQDVAWRDWAIVFASYSALVNPELRRLMEAAAGEQDPALNSTLLEQSDVQASTELYHLLLHTCTHTALDRVVNAG